MLNPEIAVKEYNENYRSLIEDFREKTFAEGNESLSPEKYDPDSINGQTWMTFVNDELASISVCEASHYTGDPDVAARICRYHILKKFRHNNAGFRMLPYQVEWAKKSGFKVVYWTHTVSNKALNAMYQHKRKMPGKDQYFNTPLYKSFQLQRNMIFRVSDKSDFLQYVYAKYLDKDFTWQPPERIIYYYHDGEELNIDEILGISKRSN